LWPAAWVVFCCDWPPLALVVFFFEPLAEDLAAVVFFELFELFEPDWLDVVALLLLALLLVVLLLPALARLPPLAFLVVFLALPPWGEVEV
jgi:hypothetical protein